MPSRNFYQLLPVVLKQTLVTAACAALAVGALLSAGHPGEIPERPNPLPGSPSIDGEALFYLPMLSKQASPPSTVLIAAGDIADCASAWDEETVKLAQAVGGTVAVLGDTAYENGSPTDFQNCYEPSWGQVKDRTQPAVGNHEYHTPSASGYFSYFGPAAGDPAKGYYSYDLGSWHVIVLNSNCSAVGGCQAGSPQEEWLQADLAAHPTLCALAYWHHPRFSSGVHGNDVGVQDLWEALYAAGAELVLNGHDHNYERFAPQDPSGSLDTASGIREFVVGTGGRSLRPLGGDPIANSQVQFVDTYGVLILTLNTTGYDWQFIPVSGSARTDSGTGECHP